MNESILKAAGVGLMATGGIVGYSMPLTSLYKSGQENRGILSTSGHALGATLAGGAVGSALGMGGWAMLEHAGAFDFDPSIVARNIIR